MSSAGDSSSVAGGPTAMEIAEFARYLGMDPVEDAALLWIAEEALCSPLPENWEEAVRRDGTPYYYNKKENKSTNKHPLEDFYRSLYKEMKDIQANQEEAAGIADSSAAGGEGGAGAAAGGAIVPSGAKEAGVRRFVTPNEVRDMSTYLGVDPLSEFSLLHIARAAVLAPLPSNWLEFEDEDGNPYYYDRNTLRVTYRHPADEKYFKQVADERARMSSSGMSNLERRLLLMKDSKRKKVEEQGEEALFWMQFVDVHGTDYWYNFKTDRMTYYKPDVLSEMDEAAIMIQSVWRGKQWRTIASAMKGNKQWAFENAAATDIQRRFRGYMMRKQLERDREIALLTRSAVQLQATFRGFRCRVRWPGLKLELQKEQREKAAVIVQSAMRRKLARNKRMHLLEDRINNNAAVVVQAAWRGTAPRKERRALIIRRRDHNAAKDVQRVYRGYQGRQRRREKEEYKWQEAQATRLQCAWRGRLGRIKTNQYVQARKIQAIWRGRQARAEYRRMLRWNLETKSAFHIQAGWHGKLGRRKFHERQRWVSSLKVQTHVRGYNARKVRKRKGVHFAARCIQGLYHGKLGRDKSRARRYELLCHHSATLIECSWRGFAGRREVAKRKEAADCMVRMMRGHMARQLVKLMVRRKAQNMHAAKIQAMQRGRKKRKMFKQMKQSHDGASSIQSAFRKKQGRKRARDDRKKELDDRQQAAMKIEAAAKRRLEKKRAARDAETQELEGAAVLIQRKARARYGGKKELHAASTKIQSVFRSKQSRSKQLDLQFGGHATKIQSRFRGRKMRRDKDQQQMNASATKIQAIQRGNILRRQKVDAEVNTSAAKIQARYRGKKERERAASSKRQAAASHYAVKIQKNTRGFLARSSNKKKEKAMQATGALKIQTRFRGKRTRERTQQMVKEGQAAASIQITFRKKRTVLKAKSEKRASANESIAQAGAAAKIQARYRGKLQRGGQSPARAADRAVVEEEEEPEDADPERWDELCRVLELGLQAELPSIDEEGVATLKEFVRAGRFPASHYIDLYSTRLREAGVDPASTPSTRPSTAGALSLGPESMQESEEDEGPEDMSDGASSTRSSAKEMVEPFADISNVRPGSGLKGGLVKAYDVERREMEDMCATIIQRHWRGVLGRRYAHEEWKNAKYNAEAKSIASIVEAYAGFIEGMQEEPREHVKARNEKTYMKSKRRADAKGSAAGGRAAGGAGGSFLPPVNPDESMNSTGRRGSPPKNRRLGSVSPPKKVAAEEMVLWPEMHVRPIWLTVNMLGGRSIEKLVETQMLGRLYKILGGQLEQHAEMLAQHHYEEHVEYVEEYFVNAEVQLGLNNAEVQTIAEQLAMTSNIFAIKSLLLGRYQAALKLFKKAELLTDPHKYRYRRRGELRAWTFDNIAYYYYRRSKFSAALQYVQKAAKVHHATARQARAQGSQETRNYGVILSHMATVYTKLGRHDYSLDYGRRALELVTANDGNASDDAAAAVCYHNISVEHVFMFSYKDAVGVQVRVARLAAPLMDEAHPWMKMFAAAKETAVQLLQRQTSKASGSRLTSATPGGFNAPGGGGGGRTQSNPAGPRGPGGGARPRTVPKDMHRSMDSSELPRAELGGRPSTVGAPPLTDAWGSQSGLPDMSADPGSGRPTTSQSMRYRPTSGQERPMSSATSVRDSRSRSRGKRGEKEPARETFPVTPATLPSPRLGQAWAEAPAEVPYTVYVYTADTAGSGTDSNVYLELHGEHGSSGARRLHASWKNCFERGHVDEFALGSTELGALTSARVGHDGAARGAEWGLERIVVATTDGRRWQFDCNSMIVDSVILRCRAEN